MQAAMMMATHERTQLKKGLAAARAGSAAQAPRARLGGRPHAATRAVCACTQQCSNACGVRLHARAG